MDFIDAIPENYRAKRKKPAEEREEITIEELRGRVKRHGPNIGLANIRIEGVVEIRDKDGNLKSKLKFDSDIDEETEDGIK